MPVSGSGVMLVEKIVPKGVRNPYPPANDSPPCRVWHTTQYPAPARTRPLAICASANSLAAGGSIGAMAGRQASATNPSRPRRVTLMTPMTMRLSNVGSDRWRSPSGCARQLRIPAQSQNAGGSAGRPVSPRPSMMMAGSGLVGRELGVDHAVQVRGCILDVIMLVLAGPAFRREHAATMDFLEIAVGKFVSAFRVFGLLVVNSQVPFCILLEPVALDELVLLLGGRLMLAPGIPLVIDGVPCLDELLCVRKCASVEVHRHGCLLRCRGSLVGAASTKVDTMRRSVRRTTGGDLASYQLPRI